MDSASPVSAPSFPPSSRHHRYNWCLLRDKPCPASHQWQQKQLRPTSREAGHSGEIRVLRGTRDRLHRDHTSESSLWMPIKCSGQSAHTGSILYMRTLSQFQLMASFSSRISSCFLFFGRVSSSLPEVAILSFTPSICYSFRFLKRLLQLTLSFESPLGFLLLSLFLCCTHCLVYADYFIKCWTL